MRRPRKDYFVILPNAEKFRMMKWLRANLQHVPEERDPNDPKINTQRWRAILEQNGWRVRETDAEVHLVFPDENGEDDLETLTEKSSKIRRPGKKYLVLISEDEKHSMKPWLRENPEHNPEGMHPDTHVSQQLRNGLKRNGWEVKEDDTGVCLIFPAEDRKGNLEAAIELLQEARSLITPLGSWIQGEVASTASGSWALIVGPDAVKFCLEGALTRAAFDMDADEEIFSRAHQIVEKEIYVQNDVARVPIPKNALPQAVLIDYNDTPGRKQQEVLDVLDNAMFEAEMQEFKRFLSKPLNHCQSGSRICFKPYAKTASSWHL